MGEANATLTVKLDNRVPVELGAFTSGMQALAALYARHAAVVGEEVNGEEVRLHIRSVASGSIIVDLVALGATISPILEHAKSIVGFAHTLKDLFDFAKGKRAAPPDSLDRTDLKLGRDFLGVAARDPQSNVQVNAAEGTVVTVNVVNMTGLEAGGAQQRLEHYLAMDKLPATGMHPGVLFYWKQAKEGDSKAGNRGVIESISPKAIRTRFSDPKMHQAMMEDALFKRAYVVDVKVETVSGNPALYTILNVIESMDRD